MFFICVEAWAAGKNKYQDQWIQADLRTMHRIISVTTQGRSARKQWVKSYYVSYSQDGIRWNTISTRFVANDDQNTKKTNLLPANIVARYIRLLPISWEIHISMRFDVSCAPLGTMPLSIEIRKISGHCFFLNFYSSAHYEIWMISCTTYRQNWVVYDEEQPFEHVAAL